LKAVGMIATLDHPSEGKIRQARPSARFSDTPAEIHRMPPRLGEHSRAILREAGFTDEDVASMIEKKVVGISD
jgi:crotonobetainyl-CoA:carnitine CoA-transferase CaiB-like acyl-CoA transferase